LPHEELAKFGPAPSDKINLEYRDHTGKLMTQKEAFRYMCWTFHGKKPSKRKQDKKKKKDQMVMNQRVKNIGETPLMKAFDRIKNNLEVPYVVLSQTKQT
jgi:U4/U6.U5 tri-snRNP-associated protein 1